MELQRLCQEVRRTVAWYCAFAERRGAWREGAVMRAAVDMRQRRICAASSAAVRPLETFSHAMHVFFPSFMPDYFTLPGPHVASRRFSPAPS